MTLNYAVWSLIRPSNLLFFLLLAGGVLRLAGRPRAARITSTAALIGFVLGGLLPFGALLIAPLENRFPEPSLPAEVDGIIVLAGGELPAQTAQRDVPHLNDHAERLVAGLVLAQRYPEALVVHSGRKPDHEDGDTGELTTASDVAAELLLGAGLEAARLVLEDRSTDTCESAAEVAGLVEPQTGDVWLLVTSAFHMPRSVACFRAVGFAVTPVPVDFRQGDAFELWPISLTSNLDRLDLAVHEWLGLAYYRARGRIDVLFPAP